MESSFDKAIALATKLDFYVFPVAVWQSKDTGDTIKAPKTAKGHTEASNDPEQIATWFLSEFTGPSIQVGVHTGRSRIVVADVDDKKGKDGAFELSWSGHELPHTYAYPTHSGNGKHFVYSTDREDLTRASDYKGIKGFDVQSGSSYVVWWGDVPESRDVFTPAPEWLLNTAKPKTQARYVGSIDEWLANLDADAPDDKVLDAITRIPDGEFDHQILIEKIWEMVRLGAEGHPGVGPALELLRNEWLRGPYDTEEYRIEFDVAFAGAIAKAGASDALIADLPPFAATRGLVTSQDILGLLTGVQRDKQHYFRTIRALVVTDLSDAQIATLIWNAPTVKGHAREWGIDYLYTEIEKARKQWAIDSQLRENPQASALVRDESSHINLLSDAERKYLRAYPNFIDRYLNYVHSRLSMVNEPYHRACAWTILSISFSFVGFIPYRNKRLGLNLFQMTAGESSTGKSDAITLRREILRHVMQDDAEYNLGSEMSPEAMHEMMVKRDGKATFLNSDEAAGFFKKLSDPRNYTQGLEDKITDWYDGFVEPVLKKSAKEIAGKTALAALTSHFFATPDRLFAQLVTDQFHSGALARYMWDFGEPGITTDDMFEETQSEDAAAHHEIHPGALEIAEDLRDAKDFYGYRRHPLLASKEALARLTENKKATYSHLRSHEQWKALETSWKRLSDAVRKCAGLLALSEGSTEIETRHVLGAIQQCEFWLEGLLRAVGMVSSSVFMKETTDMAKWLCGKGFVSEAKLLNRFPFGNTREFDMHIEQAVRSGMVIKREPGTGDSRTTSYAWNENTEEE